VKKKPCALCRDHIEWVDYKDVALLRKYMSDRGKIRSRRVTGNCAQHQRGIALAIKTARELVLLPYTQRTVTERPGGRRGGREGRPGDRRRQGQGEETPAESTTGAEDQASEDQPSEDQESEQRAAAEGQAPDERTEDGGGSDGEVS
jgi:small subunit ribosomal protein S18